jgi:hypothetical protein
MNLPQNPYAFPVGYHPEGNSADQQGMSLRDWFAGQALNSFQGRLNKTSSASQAYKYADAMLAQREKDTQNAP